MNDIWSYATIPALSVIWLTAFFGLNAVRPPNWRGLLTWPGAVDFGLGLGFLSMTASSFMMLLACIMGANIYTWRGALLMWSIATVFALAGKFYPWRRIFRRTTDMDRLEKKWRGEAVPTMDELSELIAESRRALSTRGSTRADECMRVLPTVVAALEKMALRQHQIYTIRVELKTALQELKRASNEDDLEPLVTRVNLLLDRLEGIIHHE